MPSIAAVDLLLRNMDTPSLALYTKAAMFHALISKVFARSTAFMYTHVFMSGTATFSMVLMFSLRKRAADATLLVTLAAPAPVVR